MQKVCFGSTSQGGQQEGGSLVRGIRVIKVDERHWDSEGWYMNYCLIQRPTLCMLSGRGVRMCIAHG